MAKKFKKRYKFIHKRTIPAKLRGGGIDYVINYALICAKVYKVNVPNLIVGGLALYIFAMQAANKFVGSIAYKIGAIKLRFIPPGGTLKIQLKNKNNVGVTITRIIGSIIYQNTVIAQFEATDTISLVPQQEVTAEIDFSIHATGVITAIAALVGSGGANALKFTVQGSISAPPLSDIPFSSEVGYQMIQ